MFVQVTDQVHRLLRGDQRRRRRGVVRVRTLEFEPTPGRSFDLRHRHAHLLFNRRRREHSEQTPPREPRSLIHQV